MGHCGCGTTVDRDLCESGGCSSASVSAVYNINTLKKCCMFNFLDIVKQRCPSQESCRTLSSQIVSILLAMIKIKDDQLTKI